jgi:hypothetical protein
MAFGFYMLLSTINQCTFHITSKIFEPGESAISTDDDIVIEWEKIGLEI